MDGLKEALEQDEKAIGSNQALRGSIGEALQAVEDELGALRVKLQSSQDAYHQKKEALQALSIRAENDAVLIRQARERIGDLERQLERDRDLFNETGENKKRQTALITEAEARLAALDGDLKEALAKADERESALDRHKTAILEAVNRLGVCRPSPS